MRVIDLCGEWRHHLLDGGDRRAYESTYPSVFEHYYHYWSRRRPECHWPTVDEVNTRLSLVHDRLAIIESRFALRGLDLEHLDIVLFVGQGTTNGHALYDGEAFKVWIPIETYTTELLCDVFLAHEIVHALHYTNAPSWYFSDLDERHRVGRLLITEGIATHLSRELMGLTEAESLWADALVGDELQCWMDKCSEQYAELCGRLSQQFDVSIVDSEFFCVYDLGDVYRSRAGYYVGSRLVRELVEHEYPDIVQLLRAERVELEPIIRDKLNAASV